MTKSSTAHSVRPQWLDTAAILGALPDPVLVVGAEGTIHYANPAAEQFFATSAALLYRQKLSDHVPFGSPLLLLLEQVRAQQHVVSEYAVNIGTPKLGGGRSVDIQVSPVTEAPDFVVVRLEQRDMAHRIDRQLNHRGAARSVTAMAAILAHEVKNPLSGIRGAAQLLELNASPNDHELTRLICDEADRICALVDRMEVFSDQRPLQRGPVNIHRVLEHVRKIAAAGFARHIAFAERYDPSLPPVYGDRDQLIQVFLNLVKNAAEAAPAQGGEITLTTAYSHGVRLAVSGSRERVHLPLEVSVHDNGPGVPEDIRPHLFDPFVTTKANGTGLGLALVAKIIGDHGGVIECDSRSRGTAFRVRLPIHDSVSEDAS